MSGGAEGLGDSGGVQRLRTSRSITEYSEGVVMGLRLKLQAIDNPIKDSPVEALVVGMRYDVGEDDPRFPFEFVRSVVNVSFEFGPCLRCPSIGRLVA